METHSARPRILYVTYNLPRVPATGGLTRAYHLVRAAAEIGQITLLAVMEEGVDASAEAISPYCTRLLRVMAPLPSPPHGWARLVWRLLRSLHEQRDPTPSILWRFDERPLQAIGKDLLTDHSYDLVIVEHLEIAMALCPLLRRWGGPSIADFHNILSAAQAQAMGVEAAARARGMVSRVRALERQILRDYQRVIAVSAADAARLRALIPNARVSVIPNGVDLDYFAGDSRTLPASEQIVFTGALWYRPNIDGLCFFADEIWPLIRQRRPAATLKIVGSRPTDEVRALAARSGISVHPSVADVRPYLAASVVAVVPLRLGSGTRLKILEALAAGRAVVSTTRGAEGLDLIPGHDLLLADRPSDFAAAVAGLLEQPDRARRLAAQGQASVAQCYGWPTIGQKFQQVLVGLLKDHDVSELQLDRRSPGDWGSDR